MAAMAVTATGALHSQLFKSRGPVASKIRCLSNIYLGRGAAAQDLSWLQNNKIGYILNVADDVPNFFPDQFVYCNLQVGDFGADKGISRVFEQATTFVREYQPAKTPHGSSKEQENTRQEGHTCTGR